MTAPLLDAAARRSYDGRVAIVTGGSAGIGRATVLALADAGARVVAMARGAEALARVADGRDGVVGVVGDVSSEADAGRAVEEAIARWGRLDLLVNNAGILAVSPLERVTAELVTRLFAVNVLGPSLLARAALPALRESRGSIVNVSSTFGHKAAPGIAHYAASKAALEQLTRAWALELAPNGVRVNAIAPGPTESEALARAGLTPEVQERIKADEARRVPLGRRGTPEEVAAWILALGDPAAAWVTGQVLAVDGGLSVS